MDRWLRADNAASDAYRQRVLTYGPDAARLVLLSLGDLGEIIGIIRSTVNPEELS